MFKWLILLILGTVVTALIFIRLLPSKPQEVVEPPCSELVWMRDLPQKRCVEYWKQQDLKEQNELLNP